MIRKKNTSFILNFCSNFGKQKPRICIQLNKAIKFSVNITIGGVEGI